MKKRLLFISIICFAIAGLAFASLSKAATYDLCVSFDYVDGPMLNDMRDWTADGMKYQDTIPDGNGNQIPNPQSKLNFIKQETTTYIYRQMFQGYKKGPGQTTLDSFMDTFVTEYEPRVVEGP